ncbi:MAG: prepilin peptidase [bacterium]|nr:prepilin peptidase [bacterium]
MDLWLLYLLIFVLGLCIGSFLNVLIYRLPLSLSLGGRSFCPKCKKKISWYDNIPLVSFILLRGKCRHCHSPISWQYPMVELLTGILVLGVSLRVLGGIRDVGGIGGWIELVYLLFLVSALIVIFFVDLKHEIIPDSLVYPTIVLTVVFLIFNQQSAINNQQLPLTNNLITSFVSGLFFLALYLVTRGRGMGFGDVKFAFLMGLVLGFPNILLALYGAFLTGAILGVILILIRRKRFGMHIPFGPFLAFWTLIALFWGKEILEWISARYF